MRRIGVIVAVLASLCAASARAEPAAPIELDYLITSGGLALMRFDFSLVATERDYRIDFTSRTLGVLDWFLGLRLTSSSAGRVDGLAIEPERYEMRAETNGVRRHVEIMHGTDGAFHVEAEPPSAELEHKTLTPLDPASLPGAIDPLAGVLALSRLIASGASCDDRMAVFDGRRRYDFVLSHAGWDNVAAEDGSAFAGNAERCTARIERKGGYPIEEHPEPDRPATIWVARPAPDEPPILVAFSADGHWGVVRGRLADYRHGAVHLAASE